MEAEEKSFSCKRGCCNAFSRNKKEKAATALLGEGTAGWDLSLPGMYNHPSDNMRAYRRCGAHILCGGMTVKRRWIGCALLIGGMVLLCRRPPVRLTVIRAQDVRLVRGGQVQRLSEADYITGVVDCEMPAEYDGQALMAQAVCARTRLVYQRLHGGCGGGNLCDQSAHCQGYLDEEARRARWGKAFVRYEEKIRNAVAEMCIRDR